MNRSIHSHKNALAAGTVPRTPLTAYVAPP